MIFLLLFIFGLVFSTVLGMFFVNIVDVDMSSVRGLQILQICNQVIGFLLPPLLYVMLVKEEPFNYLGLKKLPVWSLLGIVMMFTIVPFNAWVAEWNEGIAFPESMKAIEESLRNLKELNDATAEKLMLGSNLVVGILIFGLLAAISEEILFRSVIQKAFIKLFKNAHIAIIVTAFVFSAFHGDIYGFFPRFILGLMLGYMFWLSKSIWASIIMHFTNNTTIVMLYFLNKKEVINIDVENFGSTDNVLLIVLSLVVTVAIFIICNRLKCKYDN
ncbi:MAG: CPBP family intramembrane metalloprotease [Bacteroidales bacterium]|nr:CPBP family intramembrane metalloprotease [Bacteroidales bacterium]